MLSHRRRHSTANCPDACRASRLARCTPAHPCRAATKACRRCTTVDRGHVRPVPRLFGPSFDSSNPDGMDPPVKYFPARLTTPISLSRPLGPPCSLPASFSFSLVVSSCWHCASLRLRADSLYPLRIHSTARRVVQLAPFSAAVPRTPAITHTSRHHVLRSFPLHSTVFLSLHKRGSQCSTTCI